MVLESALKCPKVGRKLEARPYAKVALLGLGFFSKLEGVVGKLLAQQVKRSQGHA